MPTFPTIKINGKKIIRPSDALKSLGMSLGYDISDEILITSFVAFKAYAAKNLDEKTQLKIRLREVMTVLIASLRESEELSVADFCMASLYFEMMEGPNATDLQPIFYEDARVIAYLQKLE